MSIVVSRCYATNQKLSGNILHVSNILSQGGDRSKPSVVVAVLFCFSWTRVKCHDVSTAFLQTCGTVVPCAISREYCVPVVFVLSQMLVY